MVIFVVCNLALLLTSICEA